jgi:hypothetical protein
MNRENAMSNIEMDELEWELKRRNEIAEILATQLNEKIDECEELKSEVIRLNDLILSMHARAWKERHEKDS